MRMPAQNLQIPCAGSIAKTAQMRSRVVIWRGVPCWNTTCDRRRRGRALCSPGKIGVNKSTAGAKICQGGREMEAALQRRRFTADEYHRMAEAGVLRADDRVELVDGEIVEMSPIGSRHAACVDRLMVLLSRSLAGQGILRVQGPVRLDPHSEPQPDLSILRSRADFYASAHPGPGDVLLMVEVADASLRYDRDIKVGLYARAGIPETWLVDLQNERVDVFTQPTPQGYRTSRQIRRGERLASQALPAASLPVDEILGPIGPREIELG